MKKIIIVVLSLAVSFNVQAKSNIRTNLSDPSHVLEFDFPGLEIATAEYLNGPTGLTLFYFPQGAQAAVDIRGGSVGTSFTQEKMQQGDAYIDGITLSGGGILGLEGNAGVIAAHFKQKSNEAKFSQMPLFSGAVIYDYNPRVGSKIYPDKALGEVAYASLQANRFPLGARGAGISASVGKLFGLEKYTLSGQGAAFAQINDVKIAVFTVLNPLGMILDEQSRVIKGPKGTIGLNLSDIQPMVDVALLSQDISPSAGNTTLTVVVTNRKLSPRHLQQLGRQVHASMAQVISPFHGLLDGDVLYTVSTQSVGTSADSASISHDMNQDHIYLGYIASELAKKAVWSAVGYQPNEH